MLRPRNPTNLHHLLRALSPSSRLSLSSRNATAEATTAIVTRYHHYYHHHHHIGCGRTQPSHPRPRSGSPWRSFATTPARFEIRNEPSKAASPLAAGAAEGRPQTPAVEESTREKETAQPPPPPPPPRRRRGLVYAIVFVCLGATGGTLFRLTLSPPPLPAPGTPEDEYVVAGLRARAAQLPIVQELSAAAPEAWASWETYATDNPSLTSGALGGARGIAYQRAFWNRETGELVNVVYFGGGASGWPGVVHGGALATVLDETLGRCVMLQFPSRTCVTARLELDYRKPTEANAFYTVRAKPVFEDGDDDDKGGRPRKRDRKLWVHGHVEAEQGRVCVEARALFVVPKGINLRPMKTAGMNPPV